MSGWHRGWVTVVASVVVAVNAYAQTRAGTVGGAAPATSKRVGNARP